jgi:UDP-N-acetylmuramate-alanine ligase
MGDAIGMLYSQLRPGDVVITLSAGDGNQVGERLLDLLK